MKKIVVKIAMTSLLLGTVGCSGIHYNEGASRLNATYTDKQLLHPLFSKTTSGHSGQIAAGEAMSVNLVSAHICDFREVSLAGFATGEMFSRSNSKSRICRNDGPPLGRDVSSAKRRTRGEILIVAHAGELSEDNGLSFDAAKLRDTGRVIYYNADVRESGQLINALNIPVYGPLLYAGGRFALDLTVLELDNEENAQVKGLLEKLAAIGKTVSASTNGALIDALNTLGGTLISGNGDDVELRYQAVYDLPSADSGSVVHRMPLTEGYLALVREEHRSELPKWTEICIDKEEGLIRHKTDDNSCKQGDVYRNRTWLLLRVAKEDKASRAVQKAIVAETVGQFLDRSRTDLRGRNPAAELLQGLEELTKELEYLKNN